MKGVEIVDRQARSEQPPPTGDRWSHRVAVALVCATFLLICIGALVTTCDAGMAVPDWPTTYGYNLFLYPWQTWVFGPFDLLIEHGHRLLGATVGMLAICLVVLVWRNDERRWMRPLVLTSLALVILQGVLGGLRVLEDDRQLAKVHGCTAPVFFALAVACAAVTSHWWRCGRRREMVDAAALRRWSLLTVAVVYLQVVLGANLRHVPLGSSPAAFSAVVVLHLVMAAVVTVHVMGLALQLLWRRRDPLLLRPALAMGLLVLGQLLLGGATWVLHYGWPGPLAQLPPLAGFTIPWQGWLQAGVATAHAATGSVLLGVAVQLTLRVFRLWRPVARRLREPAVLTEEVAA